jgi:hypothetical protein
MSSFDFRHASSSALVDRYRQVGIAQHDAADNLENARYNRLFDEKVAIETELKSRPGDERRLVLQFYGHEVMQLRFNAARATLAVAPAEARAELERIRETKHYPQAAKAGLALEYLEEGRLVPE